MVQLPTGGQVSRALDEDPRQTLVVIGPEVPLEAACELAERERVVRPHLGVILLRHRIDITALGQALRSGVREVVQSDDQTALADAVRRSLALTVQLTGSAGEGGREGRIVTVFSAKGGVGKTTVATNLAAYLASTGARTLLVDLDLMFGDVAISLQLLPDSSIRDLVSMSGHLDIDGIQSVVTTHEIERTQRDRSAVRPGGCRPGAVPRRHRALARGPQPLRLRRGGHPTGAHRARPGSVRPE